MGHHFPSVGKYWEKHWEYSVLKTNSKLLFWENIGLRSQEKFLFSYFGIKFRPHGSAYPLLGTSTLLNLRHAQNTLP